MNDTRARFEEIWPVPSSIYWHQESGRYAPEHNDSISHYDADERNTRLDTFTRCQETTDLYAGLIKELVDELEWMTAAFYTPSSDEVLDRAKQIMEQKK